MEPNPERIERIEMQSSLTSLFDQIRAIACTANQAGLDRWKYADLDIQHEDRASFWRITFRRAVE